jgi:hypothetical protein
MTTMPTDLASEQAYAQENRSRIIQRLPPRLAAREDRDPTDRAAHQAAKAGGARAGPCARAAAPFLVPSTLKVWRS